MSKLLTMIAAHALCDYPLQGDFLAKAKNRAVPLPGVPWYQALGAHAIIHGAAVGLITRSPALGIAETVIHAITDDAKCRGKLSFDQDQAIHAACKVLWAIIAATTPRQHARATGRSMVDKPAFKMGDYVEKISGSSWRGRVVGTYSTDLTREGYAVESDTEKGSVQIYPAKALRLATPANGEQVERADREVVSWIAAYLRAGNTEAAIQAAAKHRAATPTEDARSRVKVLEEALMRIAGNNWRDQSRARHVARTALGNKESDRHG